MTVPQRIYGGPGTLLSGNTRVRARCTLTVIVGSTLEGRNFLRTRLNTEFSTFGIRRSSRETYFAGMEPTLYD